VPGWPTTVNLYGVSSASSGPSPLCVVMATARPAADVGQNFPRGAVPERGTCHHEMAVKSCLILLMATQL